MKNMKKNVSVRVLCLIVASVVLSGAVAFAAVLGSPYETLKNAVLDAVTVRNVTAEYQMEVTVNGVVQEISKSHIVSGDNSYLEYSFDEDGNSNGFRTYRTEGLRLDFPIYYDHGDPNLQWYCATINPWMTYSGGQGAFAMSPEDRDSSQMRFIELLIDVLVGDLKNNITMTAGDGVRIISGTLTESQVPALVRAGIDMIIEQNNSVYNWRFSENEISFDGREYVYEDTRWTRDTKTVTVYKQAVRPMTPEEYELYETGDIYYEMEQAGEYWGFTYRDGLTYINTADLEIVNEYTAPLTRADYDDFEPLEIPMSSVVISYVHGEAEVDADGTLLNLDASASAKITDIFGTVNTVEVALAAHYTDIGTSDPACPIPGAQQLLTPENMRDRFGSDNLDVYFTLNPDGSINADSITTTYPGELMASSRLMTYPTVVSEDGP